MSPKSAGQARRLETQGRVGIAAPVRSPSAGRVLSSLREVLLGSKKPSIDWMGPAHIIERD